jgi:hypothetical protein
MRRPLISVSLTKSMLHRWLGPYGTAIDACMPMARLRPRRRGTRRFSLALQPQELLVVHDQPLRASMIPSRG